MYAVNLKHEIIWRVYIWFQSLSLVLHSDFLSQTISGYLLLFGFVRFVSKCHGKCQRSLNETFVLVLFLYHLSVLIWGGLLWSLLLCLSLFFSLYLYFHTSCTEEGFLLFSSGCAFEPPTQHCICMICKLATQAFLLFTRACCVGADWLSAKIRVLLSRVNTQVEPVLPSCQTWCEEKVQEKNLED